LLYSPQVHWLHGIGWRRLALRRNLAAHPAILLSRAPTLEAAALHLQAALDASIDELCLLLAARFADRPALMMRHAAVGFSCKVC
jgi:hypothetical protein